MQGAGGIGLYKGPLRKHTSLAARRSRYGLPEAIRGAQGASGEVRTKVEYV